MPSVSKENLIGCSFQTVCMHDSASLLGINRIQQLIVLYNGFTIGVAGTDCSAIIPVVRTHCWT